MNATRTQRWGLVAALGAAFAASACCTLPLALAALGVGGAFASTFAAVEPYRGVFIGLAVVALAFAFWRSVGASTVPEVAEGGGPDCACDDAPRTRTRWALLVGAAVVVTMLVVAPAFLSRAVPRPTEEGGRPVSLKTDREVVVLIEGMTCTACARGVEATLGREVGVLAATVGMTPPEARIRYDSSRTTPEVVVETIAALGYDAEIVPR